MANEYLQRTPTSTGNRKVFTWSGWFKRAFEPSTIATFFQTMGNSTDGTYLHFESNGIRYRDAVNNNTYRKTNALYRDNSAWSHILLNVNTTHTSENDRIKLYVNGIQLTDFSTTNNPALNADLDMNIINKHVIGAYQAASLVHTFEGELAIIFMIDGQALTPDVFGYYKKGDGYISAGSTQATDFKRGQWVPKAPKVIKSVINVRGGFGVNGFYLPMNDDSNFGADFHCEPNSIIKLKGEDFNEYPQPRNGAPTTTDAYVSQLRDDPYKDYLVLAMPFIKDGVNQGFGDYAPSIKGSGNQKNKLLKGQIEIKDVSSGGQSNYYGSAAFFDGVDSYIEFKIGDPDFLLGAEDFTIETWVHPTSSGQQDVFGLFETANNRRSYLLLLASPNIVFYLNETGSSGSTVSGPEIPINQWTHLAVQRDGNQVSIYVNGVVSATSTISHSAYNNTVDSFMIGASDYSLANSSEFTGYMQDFRFYKGVAKYKGGFDVPKPYTPVGIATWRAVPDTTANNFATINPLGSGAGTFTDGNLTYNSSSDTGNANIGISTGNFYYEGRVANASPNNGYIGIMEATEQNPLRGGGWVSHGAIAYKQNGEEYFKEKGSAGSTISSYGDSYTTGDIIGIACDVTNNTVTFYKNGVSQGTTSQGPSSIQSNGTFTPLFYGSTVEWNINFGQNPTFSGQTTAGTFTDSNGKGLFKYEPPSGFLALCEDNLPTPAIKNPGEHFKTVLWTGDGAARSITGIGFTPDLVWIKRRTETADHRIFDSVRGPAKILYSNSTAQENPDTSSLTSFDDDGFSAVSDYGTNGNGGNFVAWCWKAGGAAVENTDGSITSQVSANQTAGFSIVSYTGDGSDANRTVGHGLGKTPTFIIVKARDEASRHWLIWHNAYSNDEAMLFNTGTPAGSRFGPDAPTSNVFGVYGGQGNRGTTKFISYCWTEIEGFSKFGSYVGNGDPDGSFVYCGFKPAWVMIKQTNDVNNWHIADSSRKSINPVNMVLRANLSNIESPNNTSFDIDFVSNGFKLRSTNDELNEGSSTYIFAAFAESPFTTANAK
jgi:hypothetical protein